MTISQNYLYRHASAESAMLNHVLRNSRDGISGIRWYFRNHTLKKFTGAYLWTIKSKDKHKI